MIKIKDVEYSCGCNACRYNKAEKEIEFRKSAHGGSGTMIALCRDCVRELVKEVFDDALAR